MITIRTGGYDKKRLQMLLKAFDDAQDTIECLSCCDSKDCKNCENKMPCFDIYQARMFLADQLRVE